MREKLFIVAVLITWIGARPLAADEVYLKNGMTIVGKVVEATADTVRVKTRFGVQTFSRRKVDRIVYKKTPAEEFRDRLARVDPKDVKALLALAGWAEEQALKKQSREVYEMVTHVDPQNRTAHEALGHVFYDGMWMTKKDAAAARKADEEAAKRASGLVRYKGEWVTREEKEARERGWIKVGDKWLPPEEANRARGLVRVGGEWVPKEEADTRKRAQELEAQLGIKLEIAATRRFRVFSEFDAEHAKSVATACENALTIVRDKVGYALPLWKGEQKCEVIMLRTPASYMKLTDRIALATKQPKGWAEFTKRRTSFYTVMPPASVQHGGGRRKSDMVFTAVHHVGHIAINGIHANYTYLPIWLDEGFAAWIENATLKESQTACATTGYGMVAARQDKWSSSAGWRANLKAGLGDASVIRLEKLLTMQLNQLSWREIAQAWSLIDWWITEDQQKFLEFIKDVRRRYPRYDKHGDCSPTEFLSFQNEAFKKVFGLDVEGIEKGWRTYVSTRY